MRKIPRIVITGGPCAGKTTILSFLVQKLGDYGFHVKILNEVATDFISSGFTARNLNPLRFQQRLLAEIIRRENLWLEMAAETGESNLVLICDRGSMDGRAYVEDSKDWNKVLGVLGLSQVHIRDARYDGVIHLTSVADGKPELYTCDGHPARTEDVDTARRRDQLTKEAWVGCPHLSVIGNQGDFNQKRLAALQAICRVLGIPAPVEIERKYVVKGFDVRELPPHTVVVDIVQHYLEPTESGSEERVRKRGQHGEYVYYHATKRVVSKGIRHEIETQISKGEYQRCLERRDRSCQPIRKRRHCFLSPWGIYFEYDHYLDGDLGFHTLEVELTSLAQEVLLPDSLAPWATEVTGDPHYSNRAIARQLGLKVSRR